MLTPITTVAEKQVDPGDHRVVSATECQSEIDDLAPAG